MAEEPTHKATDQPLPAGATRDHSLDDTDQQCRTILNSIQAAVVVHATDTRILTSNRAAQQLLGHSGDQLLQKTARDGDWHFLDNHGKKLQLEQYPVNRVLATRQPVRNQVACICLSGGTDHRWVLINADPILDAEEQIKQVLVTFMDITERRHAVEALQESEARYRTVSELTSDYAYVYRVGPDNALTIEWVTGALTRLTGYEREDLAARGGWEALIHPEDLPLCMGQLKALLSSEERTIQYRIITKEGCTRWMQDHARPVWEEAEGRVTRIEGAVQDITEQLGLERQLQQVQRIEAIGTLAAGIAHDFNNLLMGIQGHASLLSNDLGPGNPLRTHAEAIEEYVQSAANLTKQLLGLASDGKYEPRLLDLSELVADSSAMFGRTQKGIQIHRKAPASPVVVEADRWQLEQVLLNMYVNAWQAMTGGGELTLETGFATLDETACAPHQAAAGPFAWASITDSGSGMDEQTRRQIFDPFFTTKEKGRGTGLGLASAYNIIKNHGGMIKVESEPGQGTTFTIFLPLSDQPAPLVVRSAAGLVEGSATVLVIDDEQRILNVAQSMLEKLGYRVLTARGGIKAMEVISRSGREIDLVILDLIMPGLGGDRTFDRIRETCPGLPVLLCSGYAANRQIEEIMSRGCNGFLQKPFNMARLSEVVSEILSDRRAGATVEG